MNSERFYGEIYCIINIITQKKYIGQCVKYYSSGRKNGYTNRFKRHIRESLNKTSNCDVLAKSIRKYGVDKFKIIPILSCKLNMLNYYENYYINLYGTLHPNGYNLITGKSNYKLSEYTKNKLRQYKHTEERKQKIREHFLGKCFQERKNKLPMYIYLIKNKGYEVRYPTLKLRKVFTSKKINMEKKLNLSIKYLIFKILRNKVQRLNGNGSQIEA